MVNREVDNLNRRPLKRAREAEDSSRQQKCLNSNNNLYQDETNRLVNVVVKQNPVSIGLKLSCDEDDEHKSSITSANGSTMPYLPTIFSLNDNLRNEIDQQKEELDHYIRAQVLITCIVFHFAILALK